MLVDGFHRVTDALHGNVHATVRNGAVVGIQFNEGYEDEVEAIVVAVVGPVPETCVYTPIATRRQPKRGRSRRAW